MDISKQSRSRYSVQIHCVITNICISEAQCTAEKYCLSETYASCWFLLDSYSISVRSFNNALTFYDILLWFNLMPYTFLAYLMVSHILESLWPPILVLHRIWCLLYPGKYNRKEFRIHNVINSTNYKFAPENGFNMCILVLFTTNLLVPVFCTAYPPLYFSRFDLIKCKGVKIWRVQTLPHHLPCNYKPWTNKCMYCGQSGVCAGATI